MPDKSNVMISSTALDLPAHRKQALDACLRQDMFPMMMEHLPANDAEAIAASLKLVDEANIYVGIFAHRYGYVPKMNNPQQISITEIEYNRAVERNIPRLIFVIDKTHALTIDDVEQGAGAAKLKTFKERLQTGNIVNSFKSPDDLRGHVINSLSKLRVPDLTTFHYISDIPQPPEAFIAHPYTLLQTHRLVGRQPELNLLTDWVTRERKPIYQARILNIVALGGLGKSALTWKWFNDIAPQEMKPLAGRIWWSFYESDATFENFITRALAYVSRRPLGEVQSIPAPEREAQLLAVLDREPHLLVLDGLERILIGYARMDAAHLSDDDYDRQTANRVADATGLPASAAQSFTGEHLLRKTADPRAGAFLRKLSRVRAARILVSTRLYPADLQTGTSNPWPGCDALFLSGLADDDALELWRASGVSGARDMLLPLFNRVENHPLLIQALASEVAKDRRANSDYDEWLRGHADFNPFNLPLVQVKSHVLEFALRGLDETARQALQVIAGFRMPARYDTLAGLLIGKKKKQCKNEQELDKVLTELEDRGLVGWDKRANRYDLHPIVRGVVWSNLADETRRSVYTSLHAHFEALPMIDDWQKVNSLEDLTPAIELYNTLIGLERYDDAWAVFIGRLKEAMLYRLSDGSKRIELLEMLFPDGLEQLPRLSRPRDQSHALHALALGHKYCGQLRRAAKLYHRANTIDLELKDATNLGVGLTSLSNTLRLSGALFESETNARRSLFMTRDQDAREAEAITLQFTGQLLAARAKARIADIAFQRALKIFTSLEHSQGIGYINANQAQRLLWSGDVSGARPLADRAYELAQFPYIYLAGFIRALRLQGSVALNLGELSKADGLLHEAITRARAVDLLEEELPALVALAELRRRQGDLKAAREFLDDVWDAAERGPYPLFHADACNVLAQIERDEGKTAAAVEAASKAYQLAWCDGPPFAYHWGLEKARKLLRELGAAEPSLPPFDASKFEPMTDVEIDPEDEFHVGEQTGE
jgi:tetratricopeptide (TPR) repeat protein